MRAIAAMKQFGLLAESGSKDDRQVKITDLAMEILLPEEVGSEAYRNALRQAALNPKIHSALWGEYDVLPSDAALESHLVRKRDFNKNFVHRFIAQFRATIEFSGLDDDGIIDDESTPNGTYTSEGEVDTLANTTHPDTQGVVVTTPTPVAADPQSPFKRDVFTLDEGPVVIQWPERLSEASFEDFETWMQLILRRARRSVSSADEDGQ